MQPTPKKDPNPHATGGNMAMRVFSFSLALVFGMAARAAADPYTPMFEALRSEIAAKLPSIDDAARKSIVEAKDAKARVNAVRKLAVLDPFLAGNELDSKLAKLFILHDATPACLASFANQGADRKQLLDSLLADDKLVLQIAIADGARPVHGRDGKSPANYGKAMEIYTSIQKASPKANKGVLQRLALAVALEFSEPVEPSDDEAKASKVNDPLKRYQHFEKACEAAELDPNFDRLTVWDLRFVVCAPEPDEILAWGREMLRNYRPDHIYTDNEGGRYANVVNTDVQYGSINVGKDRSELAGMQNILMNGGICGRRSFFARYICRAFGIPATARPSSGHGASARWTPQGWVVVLGPGWGNGKTTTRYGTDVNFLASTQARARGAEFLKVKRAHWIGDVLGEPHTHGEKDNRTAPALKTAGYETGHFGKWGLGRDGTHPLKVGFDEAVWSKNYYDLGAAFFVGDSDKRDEAPVKTTGDTSVAIMEIALDFIGKRAKRDQPFFVQICFGSPHAPHQAAEEFKQLYPDLPESERNLWGEISGLDAAVGKLREELRRLGIADNTLLWFVSDNGGISPTSGNERKGGIGKRTIGLLEWPRKIPKPMQTHVPVCHMDMFPTVLDIVGVTMAHQPIIDGISLVPMFEGKMESRPKPLGFTDGRYASKEDPTACEFQNAAWIDGRQMLRLDPPTKQRKTESVTLYDILADPGQERNIADQNPQEVQRMLKELAIWRESVKASFAGKDYWR